jgi:hypothetical protein
MTGDPALACWAKVFVSPPGLEIFVGLQINPPDFVR